MNAPIVDHYELNVTYWVGTNGIREMYRHYMRVEFPRDLDYDQAKARALGVISGLNHAQGSDIFRGQLRAVHATTLTCEDL